MDLVKLVNGLKKAPPTRMCAFIMQEKLAELIKAGYVPDGSTMESVALMVISISEMNGQDLSDLDQDKHEKEEKQAIGFCDFKKAA